MALPIKCLFIGLIYFFIAKISFLTVLTNSPAGPALVWLPTGFAVAAVLFEGSRVWPGIMLGSILNSSPHTVGWTGVMGFVLINTIDPLITAWLPQRILKRAIDFDSREDIFVFIFTTILTSSLLSASVGLSIFILTNSIPVGTYILTWLAWSVSDFLGVFLLVPLLIAWKNGKGYTRNSAEATEIIFGGLTGLALIFAVLSMPFGDKTLHFVYWIIPFVIWLGFRLGLRGMTTGVFLIALIILLATSQGIGPFIGTTVQESYLFVQSFLTVISVLGLFLVAAVSERERAIQNRDDFFLLASHELNTPLTVLGMQSYFLKELLENNEFDRMSYVQRSELVRINSKEVKKLVDLVEDLLEGARIESGKLDLDPKEMDLHELIHSVVQNIDESEKQGGLQVHQLSGAILGSWDRKKLYFVVKTLVMNALKFGEAKPVELSTELTETSAKLFVEDHGIGLSKEQQSNIFQRFGSPMQVKSFGGLRQRLYISKAIISAHGGTISVDSSPGKGSKFTVELPLG